MGLPQASSGINDGNGRKAHDPAAVDSPLNIASTIQNPENITPNTQEHNFQNTNERTNELHSNGETANTTTQ
jgi:hypothetical protein